MNKNEKRKEAKICFKSWCAKVYDENAEIINGVAIVGSVILIANAISKSVNN